MEYTTEIIKELLLEQKNWNMWLDLAVILTVIFATISIIYMIYYIAFRGFCSKWHILPLSFVILITIVLIIFIIICNYKLIPINAELDTFKYTHENLLPIAPVY